MAKHVTIKLTILLLLLLLLAMAAPVVLAQTPSDKTAPKNVPQVTVPAQADSGPTLAGQISHQFKIRPKTKKSDQVDLGKVIMEPTNPYKVYKDPQFHLYWFRMDHPALALDFKPKPSK